ncbi:hypothetical protein B0H13DRAFT_1897875 [Mycena leptocephala]|nr:hypothetical protein B0H13DRAFT_1897875 [Mycena leptocephala]
MSLNPAPDFITSRAGHGSDRFVEGTSPVLIRNAEILTGAHNGTEVVFGDVLPDNSVVLGVGYIPHALTHPPHKPTSASSTPELEGWLSRVAQILPGSANNIVATHETASGENPSDTYFKTRMDGAWAFRAASDEARKIRDAQDGLWDGKAVFSESLQWESLLSVHCYESVDLAQLIGANIPTIALFASNHECPRGVPLLLRREIFPQMESMALMSPGGFCASQCQTDRAGNSDPQLTSHITFQTTALGAPVPEENKL